MARDARTGRLLAGTHKGLYEIGQDAVHLVGRDRRDIMALTAGRGALYSSGHRAVGVRGPTSVGLQTSIDGGRSWRALSLSGVSDLHALAVTADGFVAADASTGTVSSSADGLTWKVRSGEDLDQVVAVVTAGATSLVGSAGGRIERSVDAGHTWQVASAAPIASALTIAQTGVYAAAPDGLWLSADAGVTWTMAADLPAGQPTAVYVDADSIVVATERDGRAGLWRRVRGAWRAIHIDEPTVIVTTSKRPR